MTFIGFRQTTIALCTLGLMGAQAAAQTAYPSKTIKLVVPFAAGGGVDTVARLVANDVGEILKASVAVENMPGASGMVGATAVARAEPDGHTILLSSAGEVAVNPHLFKDIKYDVAKDFAPITLAVRVPNVLVVNASSPIRTLDDLIAFARKGNASFSSSGTGNPQHLAGELMNKLTSSNLVHIPYRGASQQVTDVMGDNVTATFASYLAVGSFIESGRLRALGVTSQERIPSLPNVPAMAEHPQMKGYDVTNWFGFFAPSRTSPEIIAKLNQTLTQALRNPVISKKLTDLGSYPAPMSVEDFRSYVASESSKFHGIIQSADIKL